MENINKIISARTLWDQHIAEQSNYNIVKHNNSFEYDDKKWTYHNSGLAREVYISDCGKFVIKIPICDWLENDELQEYLDKEYWHFAHPAIQHNYYEAQAYSECPEEFRQYFAKTELLSNCWVKQEFVEVIEINHDVDFREIGKRSLDQTYCIFDYDPVLTDFRFEGCNWIRIKQIVEKLAATL